MAGAWIENGPISLPTRPLAYAAGAAVVLFAALGVGMGFDAALRKASAPELGAAGAGAGKDDAVLARPIVDLAPPSAAPPANKVVADDDDKTDDALAAKTAAAQAIQAKQAAGGGDIDEVLASPTEKPPAPTKSAADEAPPGTPVKSDVPF